MKKVVLGLIVLMAFALVSAQNWSLFDTLTNGESRYQYSINHQNQVVANQGPYDAVHIVTLADTSDTHLADTVKYIWLYPDTTGHIRIKTAYDTTTIMLISYNPVPLDVMVIYKAGTDTCMWGHVKLLGKRR